MSHQKQAQRRGTDGASIMSGQQVNIYTNVCIFRGPQPSDLQSEEQAVDTEHQGSPLSSDSEGMLLIVT